MEVDNIEVDDMELDHMEVDNIEVDKSDINNLPPVGNLILINTIKYHTDMPPPINDNDNKEGGYR